MLVERGLRVMNAEVVGEAYAIASNYHADGETVIASVRAGANDFLMQPIRRQDFRDVMARLERTPRRAAASSTHGITPVRDGSGKCGSASMNFRRTCAQQCASANDGPARARAS